MTDIALGLLIGSSLGFGFGVTSLVVLLHSLQEPL
jgi:hypothetical protein